MIRCFIGITIPNDVRNEIVKFQDELKKLQIKAKFVEPENLHISLSFLGGVEENGILPITKTLDDICKNYESFIININGIKLIPHENSIRVIALGVNDGVIESIRKDVVDKIGGDSKPPHLTLCRVKLVVDKSAVYQKLKSIINFSKKFEVNTVDLIKSVVQKDGPVYTIIHKSLLR